MEDREILIGIFNMAGMILERMTGETPVIRLRAEDGRICPTYPNNSDIEWLNSEVEVALPMVPLELLGVTDG